MYRNSDLNKILYEWIPKLIFIFLVTTRSVSKSTRTEVRVPHKMAEQPQNLVSSDALTSGETVHSTLRSYSQNLVQYDVSKVSETTRTTTATAQADLIPSSASDNGELMSFFLLARKYRKKSFNFWNPNGFDNALFCAHLEPNLMTEIIDLVSSGTSNDGELVVFILLARKYRKKIIQFSESKWF